MKINVLLKKKEKKITDTENLFAVLEVLLIAAPSIFHSKKFSKYFFFMMEINPRLKMHYEIILIEEYFIGIK